MQIVKKLKLSLPLTLETTQKEPPGLCASASLNPFSTTQPTRNTLSTGMRTGKAFYQHYGKHCCLMRSVYTSRQVLQHYSFGFGLSGQTQTFSTAFQTFLSLVYWCQGDRHTLCLLTAGPVQYLEWLVRRTSSPNKRNSEQLKVRVYLFKLILQTLLLIVLHLQRQQIGQP